MRLSSKVLPVTTALTSIMTRGADAIYLPGILRLFRGDGDLTDTVNAGDVTDLGTYDGTAAKYANETPYNGVSRQVFHFDPSANGKALYGSPVGLPKYKEPRTIIGWAKIKDNGAAHLFGYGMNACNLAYALYVTKPKIVQLDQYCQTEGTGKHETTYNTWFHFAASFDGTTNRLYVDGEKIGEGVPDVEPNTQIGEGAYVYVGGHQGERETGILSNGFVADYAIFNRALTDDEVKSVFTSKDGLQAQDQTLTLQEKYSTSLVSNSTVVAFNDSSKDEEITFKLKIADESLDELGNITVMDYTTCEVPFIHTEDIISVAHDKDNKVAHELDGRYWDLPIVVDVNTGNFDSAVIPENYLTKITGSNEVQLKFCVKVELGENIVVVLDGKNEMESSISYTKVQFDVTINMETGFATNLGIKETNLSSVTDTVRIAYALDASECDDAGVTIVNPPAKNQNSMVRICISTSADNVVIADIKDLQLKSQTLASFPIADSSENLSTEISGEGTKKVIVTTQMVSAFFSDLGADTTDTIDVVGTAVMEFESGVRTRKLVRISSTYQKNKNVSDMGRKLNIEEDVGDVGLGEFAMKIGISGSSSEVEGATTSGVSNASLSATPLTTVASIALCGALMSTMF